MTRARLKQRTVNDDDSLQNRRTAASTTFPAKRAGLDESDERDSFNDAAESTDEEKERGALVASTKMESSALYKAQLMVFSTSACCLNMAFQEALLRQCPNASNFISFTQHIFITVISIFAFGLPFGLLGSKPSKVPVKSYLPLVLLNLAGILTNNASLNYGVSIPLNMIFKSSSLIANMFLGILLLSHRYPLGKYFAVLFITSGLIVCTMEDYRLKYQKDTAPVTAAASPQGSSTTDLFSQSIGIAFLTASLLLSAGTGIYQEYLRNHFGKHPDESLFYVHLLSLPFFALISFSDLGHHWALFSESTLASIRSGSTDSTTNAHISLYLVGTVLSQYACIRSVYKLTTECTSLTVTLVVTNRKFISILFSILYFGNPFTLRHWLGTVVVFVSTLLFTWIDLQGKKTQSQEQIPYTKMHQRCLEKSPQ